MSDVFLQEAYNQIKDSAWPDIETYYDFIKLPNGIKSECYRLHDFQSVVNRSEDAEYWRKYSLSGFKFDNLVYVPVSKCASTYYGTLFENLGWKKLPLYNVDFNSVSAFGIIMDPITRYLKGITEWIWTADLLPSYVGDLENQDLFNRITSKLLFPDSHTLPYTIVYGKLLEKINWIPMDDMSSIDIKKQILKFCKAHGHDIPLPLNEEKTHISSLEKLNLHRAVKATFFKKPSIHRIYTLLADDLKFYHRLVEKTHLLHQPTI